GEGGLRPPRGDLSLEEHVERPAVAAGVPVDAPVGRPSARRPREVAADGLDRVQRGARRGPNSELSDVGGRVARAGHSPRPPSGPSGLPVPISASRTRTAISG